VCYRVKAAVRLPEMTSGLHCEHLLAPRKAGNHAPAGGASRADYGMVEGLAVAFDLAPRGMARGW
jgi:hypothetical protein